MVGSANVPELRDGDGEDRRGGERNRVMQVSSWGGMEAVAEF